MNQLENNVTVSGLLHFTSQKKEHSYLPFSIRHENLWTDGTTRRDFLSARAFPAELQEKLKALPEGSPLRVTGVLRSSLGSGELYFAAQDVEEVPAGAPLENHVRLTGQVHRVKAQAEGETGTGKYVRFAVRQDITEPASNANGGYATRRDFLVVRVYDPALQTVLAEKQDGDPVTVEGTLRSSRGSGVNYVRCASIQ